MTALETDDCDHYIKTHGRKTATIDVVGALANVTIDLLQVQQARTAALETCVAQIESKPHVKFVRTWKSGRTYAPGDAATHHSALWICKALAQTVGEPSKDFARWQLAVKRGAE